MLLKYFLYIDRNTISVFFPGYYQWVMLCGFMLCVKKNNKLDRIWCITEVCRAVALFSLHWQSITNRPLFDKNRAKRGEVDVLKIHSNTLWSRGKYIYFSFLKWTFPSFPQRAENKPCKAIFCSPVFHESLLHTISANQKKIRILKEIDKQEHREGEGREAWRFQPRARRCGFQTRGGGTADSGVITDKRLAESVL